MADCKCLNCGLDFLQVLPGGHCVDYPMCLDKKEGTIFQQALYPKWLSQSLLASHLHEKKDEVAIEKVIHTVCEKVIILNTLDTLYGHVLLKLFNAFHHLDHQKEYGLVLIIPKIFEWLIPSGCAEVWIVDLKLGDLQYNHSSLQNFISNELARFKEIYLSKAYSHPSIGDRDVERLTGIAPYHISMFAVKKPLITFILREDRWWLKTRVDYWFYRICRKMKLLSWAKPILSLRQNRLVKKAMKSIKKEVPEITFFLVGLGRTGRFDSEVVDNRSEQINTTIEKAWCNIYARSEVVIGIHGSNMLLPTSLAASCVEILPEDRYGNFIQDIAVRYHDRKQLFFYRFADQYASPLSVANKVISILRDYKIFNSNMCVNKYSTHR